jgi:nicotinamidase-related amidase
MPARLADLFRARANGIFQLGTWGTEVHASLAPQPGTSTSSSTGSARSTRHRWKRSCAQQGIERIVMCGVSTNGVVHSGAREAHDRDYEVVILEDCCAGVTADEHMHAIACLGRYARIVESTAFDWAA